MLRWPHGGRTVAMVTAGARALAMACVGGPGQPRRASAGDSLRCSAREGERKREASPRQRQEETRPPKPSSRTRMTRENCEMRYFTIKKYSVCFYFFLAVFFRFQRRNRTRVHATSTFRQLRTWDHGAPQLGSPRGCEHADRSFSSSRAFPEVPRGRHVPSRRGPGEPHASGSSCVSLSYSSTASPYKSSGTAT